MIDKAGYLYIITNPAFPNFVKIGTTHNLKQRLHVYQTGDPSRSYKIEYSLFHVRFREAEKKIKLYMKPFAKSIRNEWYEVDIHMAIPRLHEVLEEYHMPSE